MTDKVKLLAIIERGKGKGNFSCFATESVDGCGINGFGRDSRETIKDMQVAVQEYKEMKAEEVYRKFALPQGARESYLYLLIAKIYL